MRNPVTTPNPKIDRVLAEIMQIRNGNTQAYERPHPFPIAGNEPAPGGHGYRDQSGHTRFEARRSQCATNGAVKSGPHYQAGTTEARAKNVDTARLRASERRSLPGDGGDLRKGSLEHGFVFRLGNKVMNLCPGTKVFISCALLATAIAVL